MGLGIKILGPWELTAGGDVLPLSGSRRIGLLTRLALSAGRVVTTDQLLTDVWGYQYSGGTRTVDVHIRVLREKLPLLNQAIETVKQFGYKLL